MPQSYTLFQLNSLVRQTIEQAMSQQYWVVAEVAECRERAGHCYMELVEKDPLSNALLARAPAKCWRGNWAELSPKFESVARRPLQPGMKVRLLVYPVFHQAYGFSWIIIDLDPTFTLGDMALQRQKIIAQLKAEGVWDMQKELELPLFCQRIAVISSATAAGYGDFVNQLAESSVLGAIASERRTSAVPTLGGDGSYSLKGCSLRFVTRLFPAIMQGEQVEQSIIDALNKIYEEASEWDCVVIIRGGGATTDLSGFDTLALAENVAQFPLPIITGIGHDRDECILDMVSHLRVKTPTAAAAYLVSHLLQVLDIVLQSEERIMRYASQRMEVEKMRLSKLNAQLSAMVSLFRTRHEARLDRMLQAMAAAATRCIERERQRCATLETQYISLAERQTTKERHRLELLEQRATALDPALLLQRGYSMTLFNGHLIRTPADVPTGSNIETRLANGTIHSQVL